MSVNEIITGVELGLIYGFVVLGIYLTLNIMNFSDLTCDCSFMIGAIVLTILVSTGYNFFTALFVSFCCGFISGLCTGLVYSYCGMSDILSGIIVSYMAYSVNVRIMNEMSNIPIDYLKNEWLIEYYRYIIIILGLFVIFLLFLLFKTDFGLLIRAVGDNTKFSYMIGLPATFIKVFTISLSNGLIGIGGGLLAFYQGFCDLSQGYGTLIMGLASLMIGRIFYSKNLYIQIISCFLGAILYRIIIGFSLYSHIFGLKHYDINIISGAIIITMSFISRFLSKKC